MTGEVRIVKRLLLVFLCFSSVGLMCVAVGCATRQAPKKEAERKVAPAPVTADSHLEIPRNCQRTPNADGSVLLTCECEACGDPEPRDGMSPVPWSCVLRDEGVFCGYNNGNGFSASEGKDTTTLEYPFSNSCGPLAPCSPAVSTRYTMLGVTG